MLYGGLTQEKLVLHLSLGSRTSLCSFPKVEQWFERSLGCGTEVGQLYRTWEILWDEQGQRGMIDCSQVTV